MMISLKGKDKATVLMSLYNASRVQGRGFLASFQGQPMTIEEARKLVSTEQLYFDYVRGTVLKVDLSGDSLDPYFYDRDNGQGAASRALAELT
jgi:hypothetical protein